MPKRTPAPKPGTTEITDEWGIYDPDKAGMQALFKRLGRPILQASPRKSRNERRRAQRPERSSHGVGLALDEARRRAGLVPQAGFEPIGQSPARAMRAALKTQHHEHPTHFVPDAEAHPAPAAATHHHHRPHAPAHVAHHAPPAPHRPAATHEPTHAPHQAASAHHAPAHVPPHEPAHVVPHPAATVVPMPAPARRKRAAKRPAKRVQAEPASPALDASDADVHPMAAPVTVSAPEAHVETGAPATERPRSRRAARSRAATATASTSAEVAAAPVPAPEAPKVKAGPPAPSPRRPRGPVPLAAWAHAAHSAPPQPVRRVDPLGFWRGWFRMPAEVALVEYARGARIHRLLIESIEDQPAELF